LTAIGAPGPNLYVVEEISENRFKISGGKAGSKVSWQVTSVRHDAYEDAHRVKVEEEKTVQERGHYLHPELLGGTDQEAIGANTQHFSVASVANGGKCQRYHRRIFTETLPCSAEFSHHIGRESCVAFC
jgi:hypothetical protein